MEDFTQTNALAKLCLEGFYVEVVHRVCSVFDDFEPTETEYVTATLKCDYGDTQFISFCVAPAF